MEDGVGGWSGSVVGEGLGMQGEEGSADVRGGRGWWEWKREEAVDMKDGGKRRRGVK